MRNQSHLLVKTGKISLSDSMQKVLTGYVVNYNLRHKRSGHLFKNRYKSTLCEDDLYPLEITRYIHLNPLRAGSKIFSDERILGSSEFVKNALADAEEKEKASLRLNLNIFDMASLAEIICEGEDLDKSELCSGSRKRKIVKTRKILCQLSVKKMAIPERMLHDFLG